MQPRSDDLLDDARMLVWRMECSNNLTVTIAVTGKWILLYSKDGTANDAHWRLGTYMNPDEAQKRAVTMTSSYERLRAGRVERYAELTLPAHVWADTVESGAVGAAVTMRIEEALTLSPVMSPTLD